MAIDAVTILEGLATVECDLPEIGGSGEPPLGAEDWKRIFARILTLADLAKLVELEPRQAAVIERRIGEVTRLARQRREASRAEYGVEAGIRFRKLVRLATDIDQAIDRLGAPSDRRRREPRLRAHARLVEGPRRAIAAPLPLRPRDRAHLEAIVESCAGKLEALRRSAPTGAPIMFGEAPRAGEMAAEPGWGLVPAPRRGGGVTRWEGADQGPVTFVPRASAPICVVIEGVGLLVVQPR